MSALSSLSMPSPPVLPVSVTFDQSGLPHMQRSGMQSPELLVEFLALVSKTAFGEQEVLERYQDCARRDTEADCGLAAADSTKTHPLPSTQNQRKAFAFPASSTSAPQAAAAAPEVAPLSTRAPLRMQSAPLTLAANSLYKKRLAAKSPALLSPPSDPQQQRLCNSAPCSAANSPSILACDRTPSPLFKLEPQAEYEQHQQPSSHNSHVRPYSHSHSHHHHHRHPQHISHSAQPPPPPFLPPQQSPPVFG